VNYITGWGRFPGMEAEVDRPAFVDQVSVASPTIARGLARSYGDSAIGERVTDITALSRIRSFDDQTGVLVAEAGFSLDEMLQIFVPRGWFPPVTPGTRFVTLGGAIGADVHGKNHHVHGSFGDHVRWMDILLADGNVVRASRTEHPELFAATIGGMGLTGIILLAELQLQRIGSSRIEQTTVKTKTLEETLDSFDQYADSTYSVAWIDCIARGKKLGRSVLTVGEWEKEGKLVSRGPGKLAVPFDLPNFTLNPLTMRAFNTVVYAKELKRYAENKVSFESFFYPLDGVRDWNRGYGSNGFLQYQFVLPLAAGREPLAEILAKIAESGLGSTLAVLKVFGAGNDSPLSFPEPGYTLALDFQVKPKVLALLDTLDEMVLHHGGKHYLAKDSRMSAETFKASYPRWEEFEALRERYGAIGTFRSAQSERLGLA
jgi:decaprenylphospho-beta-D-ribofuranose 2-oxidase